jgi:glycosyltransferase involved in cell wall biosynthesis
MKIIHLIPQDGLGGVEQAARSLEPNSQLDIEVAFLCGKSLSNQQHVKTISEKKGLNSFKVYLKGFKYLVEKEPDLLICSLWRSSMVGLTYTLYRNITGRKPLKFILFIHASKFAHLADKLITKTAIHFANEVWCDSIASKKATFKTKKYSKKIKVISFLVKIKYKNKKNIKNNNFIFWGRIAKAKRLDLAISLFEKINKNLPESLFYIYGPDYGELKSLKELVHKLNLSEKVLFMGEKRPNYYPEEALTSKFFINTSSHEGMAIAVTEAMQLGLVPIVTPVGEIANYCIDGSNSLYYDESSYENILNSISNQSVYNELSNNAFKYWDAKVGYSTDFNENCLRIISNLKETEVSVIDRELNKY